MVKKKSLFFKSKDKRISQIINITSPTAFKKSIKVLKKGGITLKEKRSLVLAKNRASAQLKRKNLSTKERKQMRSIKNIILPQITKKVMKKDFRGGT